MPENTVIRLESRAIVQYIYNVKMVIVMLYTGTTLWMQMFGVEEEELAETDGSDDSAGEDDNRDERMDPAN